ncbi:hypothetical protein ABT340_42180 [Streptosporangium sp. NPDC000239]|uniref:hypothetical protein n=1 Tax=Streptosporangium sp. NPDC000239 TaxID=3154248 RepID=UPI003320DF3D
MLDIHAVRDRCQACGIALHALSGPLSNFHDLAAGDATTAVINVITAVGQFQRDIQNKLTVEGVAAAAASRPRWTVTGARTCGRPSLDRGPGTGFWRKPGGRANRPGRPPTRPGRPASAIGVIDGKGQATRSRSRRRPMSMSIVPYRLALDQNRGESPRLASSPRSTPLPRFLHRFGSLELFDSRAAEAARAASRSRLIPVFRSGPLV